MVCDRAMAKEIAAAVVPTISAGAALRCRNSGEGEHVILQYDCVDIGKGKFQREQFVACLPSMRAVVGVASGKPYHQKTLEMAVGQISEDLQLDMDAKSVERQAYKIRAMLGHLQRLRRETREHGDNDEVYQLAQQMEPAPSQGTVRKARTSQAEGGNRTTIKGRMVAPVPAEQVEVQHHEPPSGKQLFIQEGPPQTPDRTAKRAEVALADTPAKVLGAKRRRVVGKKKDPLVAAGSEPVERIAAPLAMNPEHLHPLLAAAEAQLKVPAAMKSIRKKPASGRKSLRVGSMASMSGGWRVQTLFRKSGHMAGKPYYHWHSPSGTMYRTKGDAVKAGFVTR